MDQMGNTDFAYQAVYRYVNNLINASTQEESRKLPSLRNMAARLNVSISTIQYAYSLLEEEGKVYSVPRSGYYGVPQVLTNPTGAVGQDLLDAVYVNARKPGMLALSSDAPSLLMSLENPLLMMERELARHYPRSQTPQYQPFGELELRAALAARYTHSVQRCWQAEHVYIGPDLRSVLEAVLVALDLRGATVLVESPCSWATLRLLRAAGVRVVELPLDHAGRFDLEQVATLLASGAVRMAVLSSGVSAPHGSLMPETDKRDLARMLDCHGVWLLENDSYGDFWFEQAPLRFRELVNPDRLVTFSTLDKVVGAEAPYGYALSRSLGSELGKQFLARGFRLPPIRQKALARLFTSARIDQHIVILRRLLRDRMERMSALLRERAGGLLRFDPPRGGANIWAECQPEVDLRRVFERLLEKQVTIAPGEIFSAQGMHRHCLRLSYTFDWSRDVPGAIDALAKALKVETRGG
jgi:DNA-binding transcriptional MocR family regulator